jgi:TolB-like protein
MGLLAELKRRNVFRVAVAYLLAAWVLLQAIDFVLDAIAAPNWILQVFIIAAVAGFLMVLGFSWVFEVTPEGIKRESDIDRTQSIAPQTGRKLDVVIIAVMAVAIILLVADRFLGSRPPEPEQTLVQQETGTQLPDAGGDALAARTAAAIPREKSVAVLPFTAMSSGADDEYFADGLTEEILNALAQLPELLVTARTSSFHFKGQDIPVQEIAARLGVAHVVEGSVRRSGERLRVTAQLVRAQDGFHLWSETYDSTAEDSIAVQERIAEKIAQAMNVVMDDDKRSAMQRSGLRDGETFIAFQKGRELYFNAHGETDQLNTLRQANRYLDLVIAREPEYSPAYRFHADFFAHVMMNDASNRPVPGVTAEEIEQAMDQWKANYLSAIRYARSIEERNDLEFDYAFITANWTHLVGQVELFINAQGCSDPAWGGNVIFPFGFAEQSRARYHQQRLCDPLNADSWEMEATASLWAGDPVAAEAIAREGLQSVPAQKLYRALVLSLLASRQFEAAEAIVFSNITSAEQSAEMLFVSKAAQGDSAGAGLAAAAWLALYPGEKADYQRLLISARTGNQDEANRIAAGFDQKEFGNQALLDLIFACMCGAAWDLSATPEFAAELTESGLSWPPVSPITFPLNEGVAQIRTSN